jgi:transposase
MIGRVRLKETRSQRGFDGRILSATIRRRADRWFVSLCVERERDVMLGRAGTKPADIVGVDLGLTNAAVIHDGARTRVVEPQRALRKNPPSCAGSIANWRANREGRATERKRSCAGSASTTR